MLHKSDIMLTGRSRDALSGIVSLLEGQRQISLRVRVFGNGHSRLWADRDSAPHALVMCVDENWRDSLPGLLQSLPSNRPPFLVLCPASDIELMRTAMRAGARDVLAPPYETGSLMSRLLDLVEEGQMNVHGGTTRTAAFINAKGGSGSSFLAANVASVLSARQERKTLLIDFDFQFSSLPTYLNMRSGNGLVKALEFVDSLDAAALAGYTQTNQKGLYLLSAASDGLILPDDIAEERISKLMDVVDTSGYQDILIDIPRRFDRSTGAILERVDQVVVVTQQTVTHLHDSKRLIMLLREHLGISADRVLLVLNRFSKKAEVRVSDFVAAFEGIPIVSVPSDYVLVAESVNLGIPVTESAARSPLGKSIIELSDKVLPKEGTQVRHRSGLLGWLGMDSSH